MAGKSQLKWGSVLSYLQMILSVVISLVYTPILIRFLGKGEYGLYNTVSSTIAMLSVLSLGFNSSYIRYFAKYKKEDDNERIYRLNGLFLTIFIVIGTVVFFVGAFLTFHLNLVFDKGLTEDEYELARVLMGLLTINLSISLPMSVFSTIISANERFIFLKVVAMVKTVIGPLLNLVLLYLGFKSIGLVATTLIIALITDSIYIYFVIKKLHNRFVFHDIELSLFRSIFSFTVFIAINLIVDQINNNIDRVMLGRFKGTETVAIYAVGSSLYTHYIHISTAVSGVFTPRIHKIYNNPAIESDRDSALTALFIKVGRIQFLILMLIASGIVFFGKAFIGFWVGSGYEESYSVALLLILPVSVPLIQNLGIEMQRAANKHRFRSIVYLIMAVCNLILTVFLCKLYGATGAAVGTAISLVLANGFIMNWYYYKKLNINIPEFWKNIAKMILGMMPAFVVGLVIHRFFVISTIWSLILFIFLYALVYFICVWFFSMDSYEKHLLSDLISKILGLRKK